MSTLLRGSYREHPANSEPVGRPASEEIIRITLLLRRRHPAPSPGDFDRHLSHADLSEQYGASASDLKTIRTFAARHGLAILSEHPASRSVALSGPLRILADLFGADLELRRVGQRIARTRRGFLHVPEELAEIVEGVLGFDERPAARPNIRFHPDHSNQRSSQSASFTPPQVAKAYNFPANSGKGQSIALIELGGGFTPSDLESYWEQIGVSGVSVSAVSIDGANNDPTGDPNGPDGEVVLDIEVAGGVAPGAAIAVYFAPNTDQGFLNAINAAIHDSVRKPSVISISWGSAESEWTPQNMNAFNAAFHDAALLGISVCVAAGDDGSSDGESDRRNHVDFPASSPWVLACGGTRLAIKNSAIQSESVWNDGSNGGATGGGVSSHFSQPAYQAHIDIPKPWGTVNVNGRGVPDVAGVADPETGFVVRVDGQSTVVGGTSAVAPLWAGLIALFNEELGRNVGWLNGTLYGAVSQHQALHDIVTGTNGSYKAAKGWDACTGLGTPNGQAILAVLKQQKQ